MSRLGRPECAAEAAARHVPVNRPCPASAGNAESRVYPRVRAGGSALLVVATMLLPFARELPAQAIGQGFELERAGQYEQAAGMYLASLRADPTNLQALLGLERVLPPLNRLGELLPAAQRAAAASPANAALPDAPAQLPNAASALAEAPDAQRERIARLLTAGTPPPLTRRLAGELLLGWGEALRAWAVFEPSVVTPSAEAVFALRRFADLAGARSTPDARRVRALALARYADLAPGPGGAAARARADAARAFIEAGDQVAARAALERGAQDPHAPPDAQRLAPRTVVEALIEGGQRDAAARQLATNSRLSADDRASLRLQLARAQVVAGELDRADAELARDSSVEALALQGWIALYRGGLSDARRLFRAAGPYAGDRRDATQRTVMLALLQQVPIDSFPELGRALLVLAQGDSAHAAEALRLAAGRLATGEGGEGGGRPDLLLLAGRVAARLDSAQQRTALALFDEVVRTAGPGAAAPAAELEWARLLERRAQTAEAIRHLEHLILTYPGSAVVPEARRELERAKGAIPRS